MRAIKFDMQFVITALRPEDLRPANPIKYNNKMYFLFLLIHLYCIGSLQFAFADHTQNSSYNFFQKLTGDDGGTDKNRWNKIYKKHKGYMFGKEPAQFLAQNVSTLPIGKALDIAMGEGRNAIFLAKKGFDVEGVDISEVAIQKAKRLARENNVKIKTTIADLNKYQIAPNTYDVIIVFYYLQRSLIPQIKQGLKPNGVVVFETNTVEQLKYDKTLNKSYLLEKEELKNFFKDFTFLKYAETDDGKNAVASLIARKP